MTDQTPQVPPKPQGATGVVVLADGSVLWGRGVGATAKAVGEVCFTTSMTGYQETLTDPSYAGQIITFTFPHIGNVGANAQDLEATTPFARGCILRADITEPSNWRATKHLDEWLKSFDLVGIAGLDTRALTRRIRDNGAPTGVIAHDPDGKFDIEDLRRQAIEWPGLEGMDLAKEVSCKQMYRWSETLWSLKEGFGTLQAPKYKVVAIDFGAKRNILRNLAEKGCDVTVLPAESSFEDVLKHAPDGVFLANGPGDPAATGAYAVPMIQGVMEQRPDLPIFGICLGHQMLNLALGAKTYKMDCGHRGANHPVKDLNTGHVEITSQNHGFVVDEASIPDFVEVTHRSLFDGSVEGIRVKDKPVFSVQYHPEASPGPQESHYLFQRFTDLMEERRK